MTALAAPYDPHPKDGELVAYPVAANTIIYKGALVVLGAGLAENAGDAAGVQFVGVAYETKINTASTLLPGGAGPAGAAGALLIRVQKTGSYVYTHPAAVQANVGTLALIVDNGTVSTAATANNIPAGYVVEVPSTTQVRVRIDRSVQ